MGIINEGNPNSRISRTGTPAPRRASSAPAESTSGGDQFTPSGNQQPIFYTREMLQRGIQGARANQPAQGQPAQGAAPNQGGQAPPARPYDPNRDSHNLYQAMKGGVTGLGCDREAVFRALEGKTPEQVAALRANYRDRFDRDLDADLNYELTGHEETRAQALMRGDSTQADAAALRYSVDGLGTSEDLIYRTLEGKSAEQRQAIMNSYREQYGRDLRQDIRADMSGSELQRAEALLDGNQARADAARINYARSGIFTTDRESIYQTLEGKTPEQRAALIEEYRRNYNIDLSQELRNDLSGYEGDRAQALLRGDQAGARAATIKQAMHGGIFGLGTDEEAINRTLEGKTAEERRQILAAYSRQYGDMRADMRGDMSGNDLEHAETLLQRGRISDAQRVQYGLEEWGVNEDSVNAALRGKSREEIAQIRQEYRQRTGRELDSEVVRRMSGRDEFDAQMSLQGRAETPEEALRQAHERREYERSGMSNWVPGVGRHNDRLDRNLDRAEEQYQRYQQAVQEGRHEDAQAERARLNQLIGYTTQDVEILREAKDTATDVVSNTLAGAAAIGVTVLTAGTAAPAVVALYGGGAATGTRVLTRGAMQGDAYTHDQLQEDLLMGAVDGVTGGFGGRAGALTVRTFASEAARRQAQIDAFMATGGVVGRHQWANQTEELLRTASWRNRLLEQGAQQGTSQSTGLVPTSDSDPYEGYSPDFQIK